MLSQTASFGSIEEDYHTEQEKKKKRRKGENSSQGSKLSKEQQEKLARLFLDAEKAKVTEDWDAAIKSYNEVISIDGKNHNAHFQLAQIYFNQRKLAEAQKEAEDAYKLDETNKWYLEMLANIYMSEGKTREAAETFRALMQKFPNDPDNYLNLGFMQAREGQFEQAVKTYDQYEKLFGIDESVVLEKKNMYLRLNKFNDAVNEIHKLVDAFPGEISYMLMEAELYHANRMKEKAAELYKKILDIEPDNAQALLAMADLGVQGGNNQQSVENIKKIFENPKTDIWFGGTGDPHLQAAEQGLTLEYQSPTLSQLHVWAQQQAQQSGFKTVGIYSGPLGFGYNPELLAKKKMAVPKTWADLLKPEYRGEIQVANPTSSGTAYTMIATLVQLMGEDKAFDYLKNLHRNVSQYTRSGTAPIKAVARGETAISISLVRYSAACSLRSSGISTISYLAPSVSSSQMIALLETRSTRPLYSDSAPIGSCVTSGLEPRRSTIMSTVR